MGVQGGLAKIPARGAVTLDDEAALVAAAQRNRRDFGPLYGRYANPVYKYCFAQLGDRQAAEDATSLVFTKALGGLPSFHGGSFRAWLFTIARNVVTDQFRGRRFDAPLEAAAVAAPGATLDDLDLYEAEYELDSTFNSMARHVQDGTLVVMRRLRVDALSSDYTVLEPDPDGLAFSFFGDDP